MSNEIDADWHEAQMKQLRVSLESFVNLSLDLEARASIMLDGAASRTPDAEMQAVILCQHKHGYSIEFIAGTHDLIIREVEKVINAAK